MTSLVLLAVLLLTWSSAVSLHHRIHTPVIHIITRTSSSFWQSFYLASQSPDCTCVQSCPGPVAALISIIAELQDSPVSLFLCFDEIPLNRSPPVWVTIPPHLTSSPNLLRVDSVPLPTLVMKMLNVMVYCSISAGIGFSKMFQFYSIQQQGINEDFPCYGRSIHLSVSYDCLRVKAASLIAYSVCQNPFP